MHALALNLPVTFINQATGPHSFDLFDDSETSRQVIQQILGFLRFQLALLPSTAAIQFPSSS